MYCGTNPTALKSQQWLTDSLISLMNEKPYSQITIGEICKRADLSRQTFYNFFDAKEEIIHFYIRNKYEKQFANFSVAPTMHETVNAIAVILEENRETFMTFINNGLNSIIADEMSKCISIFAKRFVHESDKSDIFNYQIVLLSGAFAHLFTYWLSEENPISTEKLTELLISFLTGKLYKFNTRKENSEII